MPKLIDQDARRRQLAQATWAVILRDGIGRASVRAVAAEAGLSAGSLRHTFPTQVELLEFSMRLVNENATKRVLAHPPMPARLAVETYAKELLPLDADRRAEIEINLLLISLAATEPRLAAIRDESRAGLARGCRIWIDLLIAEGEASADLDAELEAKRLHAVLDGLALYLAQDPPDSDTRWAVQVLGRHLDSLR